MTISLMPVRSKRKVSISISGTAKLHKIQATRVSSHHIFTHPDPKRYQKAQSQIRRSLVGVVRVWTLLQILKERQVGHGRSTICNCQISHLNWCLSETIIKPLDCFFSVPGSGHASGSEILIDIVWQVQEPQPSALRPRLVRKKLAKSYCSTFRCYLTNNVQS